MLVFVREMLIDVLAQLSSSDESLDFIMELKIVFELVAEIPVVLTISL